MAKKPTNTNSYQETLSSGKKVTITTGSKGGVKDIKVTPTPAKKPFAPKPPPPPPQVLAPKPPIKAAAPLTPQQIKAKQDAAKKWFIGKARTTYGYRMKLLKGEKEYGKADVTFGKMYFYLYNPKHKATLPIYDVWPLVFPIEPYPDGFLGLNMHYLPPNQRKTFLDMLKQYTNNNKMNKSTRITVDYDALKSSNLLRLFGEPCIHRYLYNHVLTRFIEIQADEWDYIINLPLELFIEK